MNKNKRMSRSLFYFGRKRSAFVTHSKQLKFCPAGKDKVFFECFGFVFLSIFFAL